MGAPRVGVMALQGDVREHVAALADSGAVAVEIRRPEDLDEVDGIVLPGGESTTMSMLLDSSGLREALARRLGDGMPALGTCAGLILLAKEVLDGRPDQRGFDVVDVTVRRNGFGRQRESFECRIPSLLPGGPLNAVFIRAPRIERVGAGVEVLASVALSDGGETPVLCRQGSTLVASFHPELSGDPRVHELFVSELG